MPRTGTVGQNTRLSWGYYGYPGSPNRPVGEVGYIVDWHADQISRLDWDVFIDGSPSWVVDLNTPETKNEDRLPPISTNRPAEDGQMEEDQTAASTELLQVIDWNDTNVRAVDTNLFVAGWFDYANLKKGWRVVSTIEPKRKETLETATDIVEFIRPHPANPKVPNPPLTRILELLESLEWLTRQSSAQSKQRVLMNGIIVTADTLNGPDGKSFWDIWNETLSAKQVDPDDMSPVRVQAQSQDVKEGALDWVLPPFGYDQVLDRKITATIQRLAWGMPVPPEILLGMQAQSRATAFQVEENSYRAHIEPTAMEVAQVAEDALALLLPDFDVKVVPNPSRLLARKNSVEDVKWAREQGLVTPEYTREVMGIPEDAAPEENDGVPISGGGTIEPDPANVAADEPVTAAAGSDLSELLADIDAHLSSELAGVTVMATDRARQRLGAAARSNETVRSNPDLKGLSSAQVAVRLGIDGLVMAGVRVDDLIAEPVDSATRWWVKRVSEAWEQASTLIPGWTGQGEWVEDSVEELANALSQHVIDTLGEPDLSPLEAGDIRAVVDAAAGGS